MLGVRVKGGVDQLVGDVGPVELSGVDVVHAQLDGPAEHGQGRGSVARRTRYTWSKELHGAVANARHGPPGEDGRAAGWIDPLVDGDHLFTPLIAIRVTAINFARRDGLRSRPRRSRPAVRSRTQWHGHEVGGMSIRH